MSKYWIIFEGYLNWQVQNGSHLTAARVNHNICKVFSRFQPHHIKRIRWFFSKGESSQFLFAVEILFDLKCKKCFVFVQIVSNLIRL